MNILALDLSTKNSGYAIFKEDKLIQFDSFSASSTDVIKRIQRMTDNIYSLLEHLDFQIDKIIIEEILPKHNQYGVGNLHTQKVLSWLQASIIFMLHDDFSNIDIEYFYPSEWRALCNIKNGRGIKRNEEKELDIKCAKKLYNIEKNIDDDTADAICIGHAYIIKNKENETISWE